MALPGHLVVDLTSDDEGIVDGGPDWDAMAAVSYADLDLQDAIVVDDSSEDEEDSKDEDDSKDEEDLYKMSFRIPGFSCPTCMDVREQVVECEERHKICISCLQRHLEVKKCRLEGFSCSLYSWCHARYKISEV